MTTTTTTYTASVRAERWTVAIRTDTYPDLDAEYVMGEGVRLYERVGYDRWHEWVTDAMIDTYGAPLFGDGPHSLTLDDGATVWHVDRYEHGRVLYSLAGEGPACPWDTSSHVARLVLPPDFTDPEGAARCILDQVTAWQNGDVYWLAVIDEHGTYVDDGGGFIGYDGVEEAAREVAENLSGPGRIVTIRDER